MEGGPSGIPAAADPHDHGLAVCHAEMVSGLGSARGEMTGCEVALRETAPGSRNAGAGVEDVHCAVRDFRVVRDLVLRFRDDLGGLDVTGLR